MIGCIVMAFELLSLITLPYAALFIDFTIIFVIGWVILRTWAIVNSGIFFSRRLNLRSFPILAPHLSTLPPDDAVRATLPGIDSLPALDSVPNESTPLESLPVVAVETLPPEPIEAAAPRIKLIPYALTIAAVVLGAVIYSLILFAVTHPHVSAIVRSALSGTSANSPLTVTALLLVLEAGLVEEVLFRLGLQNYLGYKLKGRANGYWIAIVLTTILWTLGHVGSLDPDWVKLVQVFPLGLVLGWLFKKYGAESAILAHCLFNLAMAFTQPSIGL
jgi:membrane protease YdiL (CAAX protease family)